MKTVLTGASGFLGSYIANELVSSGAEVLALCRDGASLQRIEHLVGQGLKIAGLDAEGNGDLEKILGEFAPDNVIHVAAKSRGSENYADLAHFIQANITFGSQLAQAMITNGVKKLIYAGTSWQWNEDGSYSPFNFYAATKQALEDVLVYYASLGIDIISLRLFDVIGPADDRNRLVDLLVKAGLTRQRLDMSPGEQQMYLIDVRDAARAFVYCARDLGDTIDANCRMYALRSESSLNLRELVRVLQDATGLSIDVNFGGRSYRPREIMSPYGAHPTPPGWKPEVPLMQTLSDIAAYHRQIFSISKQL